MSFLPRCKSEIIAIIIMATNLISPQKFQHYISIFDLVTEENRRSRYLGDVAWIGRGTSFQLRCKSQTFSIITSATKLMSRPNCSVTSQFLT